jgi:hypothetical protein
MSDMERLREENERLQQQLDKLTAELEHTRKVERDLWSHEIYLAARKKMLAGLLAIIGVLSALGLLTVWEFYTKLEDYATDQAITQIQGQLKDTLPEIIEAEMPAIVDRELEIVRVEAREAARATVSEAQEEITRSAESARMSVAQTAIQAQVPEVPPEDINSTERFYVIAGSSPLEQDLESELARVEQLAAGDGRRPVDEAFPDLQIAPPNRSSRNFALVIGGPLPRDAAQELKNEAIEYGFRSDTFLWPDDRVYFLAR